MQLIAPYTFEESQFKKIDKKEVFIAENLNFVDLFQIAWECNEKKRIAPLLASIDPYDNTVFNGRQCEIILSEIDEILKFRKIENLQEIIKLLKSIDSGSCTYLFLRGD